VSPKLSHCKTNLASRRHSPRRKFPLITRGNTHDSFHIEYRRRCMPDCRCMREPPWRTRRHLNLIKSSTCWLISVDGLHALDLSNFCRHSRRFNSRGTRPSWRHILEQFHIEPVRFIPRSCIVGDRRIAGHDRTFGTTTPTTVRCRRRCRLMVWAILAAVARAKIGTNVAWDEAVDIDLTRLDAGGGLNPNFLVRNPNNGCKTILPHEYLRREHDIRSRESRRWTNGLDRQTPLV